MTSRYVSRRTFLATAGGAVAATATGCGATASGSAPSAAVTMWTFKQSHVNGLRAVGRQFTKAHGIPVQVQVITPQEAYITKYQAAARTKQLPDLLTVGSASEDFKNGAAGILQDVTTDFTASWRSELLPGVAAQCQLSAQVIQQSEGGDPQNSLKSLQSGHWYAVPYVAGASGIVIARKSFLQAAGVSTDSSPGTWEDLVAGVHATRSKDASTGGIVTGMQVPETAFQWLYRPMAYHYLGHAAFYGREARNPDPSWTSPQSVETFQLYDQMSKLWEPGVLALGIDQADQSFAQGQAAWDVGGTYTLPFLMDQGLKPSDLMMFPVPPASGSQLTQVSLAPEPILSVGLTTQTQQRAEAVAFMRFLTSSEGAQTFAAAAQDIPATTLPSDKLSANPLLAQIFQAFKGSSAEAFNADDFSDLPPGNPPVKHAAAVTLAQLVTGSATPLQVAKQTAADFHTSWSNTT